MWNLELRLGVVERRGRLVTSRQLGLRFNILASRVSSLISGA